MIRPIPGFGTRVPGGEHPEHFFEVEMRGVIRQSNDRFLSTTAVYDYLAQVAPVPFHPNFDFGETIASRLNGNVQLGNLQITLSGIDLPVYRPYRNTIISKTGDVGSLTDLEIISVPSLDGEEGALMWFAHHPYNGTLPDPGIRGLRARAGNIQVGDNGLFQEQFGETRFNGWTIGEVHVFDSRIVPNGRRDHFEQNAHFDNWVNQIAPHTRTIGNRCRESSKHRNRERNTRSRLSAIEESIDVLRSGIMSSAYRSKLEKQIQIELGALREAIAIEAAGRDLAMASIVKLERKLSRSIDGQIPSSRSCLNEYSTTKRNAFEKVFDLIYELSPNPTDAAKLVTQIAHGLAGECRDA